MLRVELAPDSAEELSGWVEILATGQIGAHAELIYTSPTGVRSDVTIPMDRTEPRKLQLAFDNSAGNRTAIALLNVPGAAVDGPGARAYGLLAVVRDEAGQWIETRQYPLQPGRHTAFMLADEIPATAGRRGTIEIRAATSGPVSGVSLRVSAQETFVVLPAV
jgi:hypothetical protein